MFLLTVKSRVGILGQLVYLVSYTVAMLSGTEYRSQMTVFPLAQAIHSHLMIF